MSLGRRVEGHLLGIALLVGAWALALVHLARYLDGSWLPLLYGYGALVAFVVAHLGLRLVGNRGDGLLLPLAAALVGLGLAEIYRLDPELMLRQATWIALGLAALIATVAATRDPAWLARYKYLFASAGVVLLAATLVFGAERGGARQWIVLGPISMQPSEAVKILLVIFFAGYLSERRQVLSRPLLGGLGPEARHLGPLALMLALSLLLLAIQRDLGAALLYFGVFIFLTYAATGRARYALGGVAVFLALSVVAYAGFGHVRVRVDAWINPWADFAQRGFQIAQGLFALASGGVVGTGLGYGFPEVIPAASTDMIFAALGEELGFAGAAAIVLLYVLVVSRGFAAAIAARSEFESLLAAGLAAALGLQTIIILGGVVRLLPLTGITLPFVSYGGSSILSNFVILGMLLSITDRTERSRATAAV